jgi:hypothetical protein
MWLDIKPGFTVGLFVTRCSAQMFVWGGALPAGLQLEPGREPEEEENGIARSGW